MKDVEMLTVVEAAFVKMKAEGRRRDSRRADPRMRWKRGRPPKDKMLYEGGVA